MPETARQAVVELTHSQVDAIERLRGGVMTYCYVATVASQTPFVVRFYPEGRQHLMRIESAVLARARRQGVAVPTIVGDSDALRVTTRLPFMIYEMVRGQSLADFYGGPLKTSLDDLAREVVRNLVACRDVDFSGFGTLVSGYHADCLNWPHFIETSWSYGVQALKTTNLLPSHEVGLIAALEVDRIREILPPCPRSVLVWADASPSNVIVDDRGRFAALVDFEGSLAGDPLLTLGFACARARRSEQTLSAQWCAALLRAWNSENQPAGGDVLSTYALLRLLRVAPFFHARTPIGTERDPLSTLFPGSLAAAAELGQRYATLRL